MAYAPGHTLPHSTEGDVIAIIRKVGINALSLNDIRTHLEGIYKLDFKAHKSQLVDIVRRVVASPEFTKVDAPSVASPTAKNTPTLQDEHPTTNTLPRRSAIPHQAQQLPPSKLSGTRSAIPAVPPRELRTARDFYIDANIDSVPPTNEDGTPRGAKDVERILKIQFGNISMDEEVFYTALATRDKSRYNNEMDAYLAQGGDKMVVAARSSRGSGVKQPTKKQRERDPNLPKRPLSSYMFFSIENRSEIAKQLPTHLEICRCLSEMWASVSTEDKARYEALAAKDRDRYVNECRERGYHPLAFRNTPITTTTAPRRYTLNRDADSSSRDDSLLFPDDDDIHTTPPNMPSDREGSVVSVISDVEGGAVVEYHHNDSTEEVSTYCPDDDGGACKEESVPRINSTLLSDADMVAIHTEFNAEHTSMDDAIEELQSSCDALKASLDAERCAYFKVKILLGKKRRLREIDTSCL